MNMRVLSFALVVTFSYQAFAQDHQAQARDPDREIVLPRNPAVSPDGSRIAFAWRGDIWVAAAGGGEAQRVTSHPGSDDRPVFHPDGEQMAFVSSRAGGSQVFMVTLSGGAPRQVTFDSHRKSLVGFADGGQSLLLAMASDRHFHRSESQRLYVVDLAGGKPRRMLFDAGFGSAVLSPDGTKVLFTRGRSSWWRKGYRGAAAEQLWLADLSQQPPVLTRLAEDRPEFQNVAEMRPIWAPDGAGYYYVSDPDGTFDVYYRSLDGRQSQRITNVAAGDGSDDGVAFPALSADGKTMVVRRLFHLHLVDLAARTAAPIRLTAAGDRLADHVERRAENRAQTVAFTPDGKQMAFTAGEDIYVMDRILKEPVRVTGTQSRETDLLFSKDGRTLWFVSDAAGELDVWAATCPREDGIWWLGEDFALQQVTSDRAVESRLSLSPSGEQLAFTRDNELWVMATDGTGAHAIVESWSAPSYDWSPDDKWLTFATQDDDYNHDIWIVPVDGSRSPFNLSRHPGREGDPVWSSDGSRIAFTGRRDGEESDIYYVNLAKEKEEKTGRDRKLEKAMAAMKKKASGKGREPKTARAAQNSQTGEKPADGAVADADNKPVDDGDNDDKDETVTVTIDFDGILDRLHRIRIADSRESGLMWSPDGKKLLFSATVANVRGIYSVEFPDLGSPKKMAASGLTRARWLEKGNEIVGLASGGGSPSMRRGRSSSGGGGVPASMSTSGKIERFEFTARQTRDWTSLRQLAFDQGWRAMRDRFYDPAMNNRDWQAVRAKYRPVAAQCLGRAEFNDLMNLMLGELNASHMGHSGGNEPLPQVSSSQQWTAQTHHLGLRFAAPTGKGLQVTSVIPESPCAQDRSKVDVGETVMAVDGRELDGTVDLGHLLTFDHVRDVELVVRGVAGIERKVIVRPVPSVSGLLYEEWVEATRAKAEQLSEGRLGYLHIRGMNMSSVRKMEEDLYAAGHDKDGLIIDVRFNGGGSTTDHVLTILTQPVHAITQSRNSGEGYPVDRKVYATWSKPIVLMCNEYSFSNAEILSHAVKQLGRGRLVGMRTGGGVISTGSVGLVDGSRVRMPMRGWYLVTTGEDMELNGCLPDLALWNPPGGDDVQLHKAVTVLSEEVAAERAGSQATPVPAASKRRRAAAVPAPGGGNDNGGGR